VIFHVFIVWKQQNVKAYCMCINWQTHTTKQIKMVELRLSRFSLTAVKRGGICTHNIDNEYKNKLFRHQPKILPWDSTLSLVDAREVEIVQEISSTNQRPLTDGDLRAWRRVGASYLLLDSRTSPCQPEAAHTANVQPWEPHEAE